MKFRVTFSDKIDLLIEADKEVEAVRKAKELKDKLSKSNLENSFEIDEDFKEKDINKTYNDVDEDINMNSNSKINDYNRYENETDKEFLKSAISEMNKYVSNWNFMSEREKKDITGGQGIGWLRKEIKLASDRLEKLK